MMNESQIQKLCIDYLRLNKWMVVENYKNTRYLAGIPDICVVKKGHHAWIEFKRGDGRQSKEQLDFEIELKNHGGCYVIIRSLDDLMTYLGDFEQGELFR